MVENINEDINYIKLDEIYNFAKRNIKYLSSFSTLGILIISCFIFTTKKMWNGQFQIVIEESKNSLSKTNLTGLPFLAQNQSKSLETEREILKSPSVLINVFEFVKDYDPSYNSKKILFKDWSKKIDVEFTKNTSVLNITYRDNKKSNIIPVLKKISEKYQNYSGSRRERELKLSIDYFKDQIEILKKQSLISKQRVEDFAAKYDLLYENSANSQNLNFNPTLNIESERVKQSNKIRKINELIESTNFNKNKVDKLTYLAEILIKTFDLENNAMIKTKDLIYATNLDLLNKENVYNENDRLFKSIREKKGKYKNLLYNQIIGFLEAEKESANANLKSLKRPLGVISEYKELLRTAAKDEAVLSDLEDQLRINSLEYAKNSDPWQLITNPTLNPTPLPSYKLRKLILGLLAGLITGAIFCYLKEKKRNKIYSQSNIESIFENAIIDKFKISEKNNWTESINLFSMEITTKFQGKLKMLLVDMEENDNIKYLVNLFNKSQNKLEIIITKNIIESIREDNFILVVQSCISSIKTINIIKESLIKQNKNMPRVIFIDF